MPVFRVWRLVFYMKNVSLFGRAGFAVGLFATPFGRCFAPAPRWLPSLTLCLVLAVLAFGSNAQTFIKRFNIEGVNSLSHNLKVVNDDIILLGVMIDTSSFGSLQSFFAKANLSGDIGSYQKFRPQNSFHFWATEVPSNASIVTDDGIVTVGYHLDSIRHIMAVKYNFEGDTVFWKYYPNANSSRGICVIKAANGGYYIAGSRDINTIDGLLIKIDESGGFLWKKALHTSNTRVSTSVSEKDSTIILCGYLYDYSFFAHSKATYQNEIYQFDLDGNEISYWISPDTSTATPLFKRTSDGGYISVGQKITTRIAPDYLQNKGCIIKWDSAFNPVWEQTYGTEGGGSYFYDIEENADGTFVVCGSGGYFDNSYLTNEGNGWLMKIAANGDMLWSYHYYGITPLVVGEYYENQLYDLAILPDGDIVAVGYASGPGAPEGIYQQSYLLRVHADGCFDDGTCGSPIIVGTDDAPTALPPAAFSVSPNPARQHATLTTSDTWRGGHFELYDGTGRIVAEGDIAPPTQQISLAGLPSGMYVLVLRDTDGKTASAMVIKQ